MSSGQTPNKKQTEQGSSKDSSIKGPVKSRDMGAALRSVYQKTVEEDVPDDLLNLLGKLD